MSKPLVTVLTAVRNGALHMPAMLESVSAQTVTDWEHIIVDDASEDDTVALVKQQAERDPRVRLIQRSTSSGPYVAANDGLEAALGDYVARIDADDVAPPDRLDNQLRFLREHPGLRACGGYHQEIDESGEVMPAVWRVTLLPGVLRWQLCIGGNPVHSTAFVERSALEELGGYAPLRLAQDWRLWSQLSRKRWLGIVPEVVAFRRMHSGRLTHRESSLQAELALEVMRDHIAELSGAHWSSEDIRLLWLIGRDRQCSLWSGLRAFDRWSGSWRADSTLSQNDRQVLEAWSRWLRRRHIMNCRDERPLAVRWLQFADRTKRRLRRVRKLASRRLRARTAVAE